MTKRYALLSVTDKSDLIPFAQGLHKLGFTILSTGGTAHCLEGAGVNVVQVSDHTGFDEIMDGRVKTLHPRIHAGILGREADSDTLLKLDIPYIDVVVCNLYPFQEMRKKLDNLKALTEYIDVGGPSMIRAAAKNWQRVYAVTESSQYGEVLDDLKGSGSVELRQKLAATAFRLLSNYDSSIAESLSSNSGDCLSGLAVQSYALDESQELRYGENPHQSASFLFSSSKPLAWEQLQGKELSYNNLLDLDNALRWTVINKDSNQVAVAIFKHASPCGAAISENLCVALQQARSSDPRSHFGGIIAFNKSVDKECASQVIEHFTEIVVAPEYSAEALDVFAKRAQLRVIAAPEYAISQEEFRSASGGVLMQQGDSVLINEYESYKEHSLYPDIVLAWNLCQMTRSNAITLVADGKLVGSGVGETSRIDALENALRKVKLHGHSLSNAVAASDAFFPFPDSIELLAAEGVRTVLSPAGSKNDDLVKDRAEELGVELIFMSKRHFRH